MADTTPGSPAAMQEAETASWMRATAAALAAAGLDARLHDTHGVLDIRARLNREACKPAEIIIDDDGYVQITYWNAPGATPTQVTAIISRVLTQITTAITVPR